MNKTNLLLYKDTIQPVGDDYILLFDIDDTLYKSTEAFHQNQIKSFHEVYEKLRASSPKDLPPVEEALKENPLYTVTFREYFDVSPAQLESLREQCDYREFLARDDELITFLSSLPFRKWAFTNGVKSRALAILDVLGLTDTFEGVVCFDDEAVDLIGKPRDSAFEFVENLLGIENKKKVYFYDDAACNIQTGTKFGWNSILVRKDEDIIDLVKDSLKEIN